MIVCPKCNNKLDVSSTIIKCDICSYFALKEAGIIKFHPDIISEHQDYNSAGLDCLYEFENKYFWFQHRKQIISKAFQQYVTKDKKIIEIGAGTGNVSQMLLANGYKNMAVGEMHLNGLKYAKKYGLTELYQFDLLKAPFKNQFDVVCMFDVLEHIEDDNLALQKVNKMLSSDGKLVITVPAHQWLWSNIDSVSGHKRRYSYEELKEKLEKNGFIIESFKSFFILLIPLLFLRKLWNKKIKGISNDELSLSSGLKINPAINSFLSFICMIENFLFSKISIKFGGSLLIIAKKINLQNDTIQ